MQDLVKFVEQSQLRSDLPELEIGDLIRVYLKVKEGTRERLQLFEGYLIAMQGGGIKAVSYTHLDVYKRQGPHQGRTHQGAGGSAPGAGGNHPAVSGI